jgi:HNH endonuclease
MSDDADRALTAAIAALPGQRTDHCDLELRARIRLAIARDWLCGWCEEMITPQDIGGSCTHKDHIIPRARGGPDESWNIELLHERCNRAKRSRMTRRAYALAAQHGIQVTPPDPGTLYRPIAAVMNSLSVLDRAVEELSAAGPLVDAQAWATALPYLYEALAQGSRAAEAIAARAATAGPPGLPEPTQSAA